MSPGGCVAGLPRLGYTAGMEIAISIPDDVFADAEKLARALKKSRSQLYSHALKEYVARHAADQVTEALDGSAETTRRRSASLAPSPWPSCRVTLG
jgi:predicted transcriptional regulator